MGNGHGRHWGSFAGSLILLALTNSTFAQTAAASNGSCPYWIDSSTGERVPTTTIPAKLGVTEYRNYILNTDKNHAYQSGQGFVLIPCPPPTTQTSWTGPYGGIQVVGSWSTVGTNEFLAATGARTNAFNDSGSGFGGGFNIGYNWQPWGNSVVVGVAIDANILSDSVKHSFVGGTSIASTITFDASAMARAGVLATPNLLLFGQTGFSVANQNLKINFGGPVTNENQLTPGFSLGAGAEWQMPTSLFPSLGPTSLFVDYAHTWWRNARLNMPVASPLFKYTWMRQSDAAKVGVRVRFSTQ